MNHVAHTYAGIPELLDTYARLRDAGIEPYWSVHHGTTLSNYYLDPDGNRMEFQVDVGSVAEATAYMASPTFGANPVGVEVDFEDLLARFNAGEDAETLLVMPAGPASPIPALHGMT